MTVVSNVMPNAVRTHEVTDDAQIGRYRILRRLEINATSEMSLAVTEGALGFERSVIIKRLLPHANANPKRARTFGCEASAYARLTHPAIVRLYDFLTVDEMPTMVLEHVDGVSLHELLEDLRARGERLPLEAALYIGARVFAALGAAHAASDPQTNAPSPVIHRDVSPGNILIAGNGEVKLSNFGFAKLEGSVITEMSMEIPKGTVGYMAPEQLLGEPITPRTDVYGGALLVRELLTGEPAFVHGDEPYVDYLQSMAMPSLTPIVGICPELSPAIADVLQNALEPHADARRVSATDVQRVLNGHRQEGRAKLREVLGRLGLARGDDLDETDDSSITVASMARLEARARRARIIALTFAFCALLFGVIAARSGMLARDATAASNRAPQVTAALGTSPAPPSAAPKPIPPPPMPTLSPTPTTATGELRTLDSRPSHRIFVDGRWLGQTGATFTLPCGSHHVRIGSGGKEQSVAIPCGGTAEIGHR